MKSGVYRIKNLVTRMFYIGSSVNCAKRFTEHRSDLIKGIHDNQKLQNAWDKYGENCFSFLVIFPCFPDKLLQYEQLFIDDYWDSERLYNILPIAGSSLGFKMTDETKQKMSIAQLGRVHKEETKEKIRRGRLGKKHSEETKNAVRKANSKKWLVWFPGKNDPVEIESLERFCKVMGLDSPTLKRTATGKQKHHHGFKCLPCIGLD